MPWKPDYISVVQANAFLRLPDSVDDAEVGVWVTAASRAIDNRCNRQFGQLSTAAARAYRRPAVWDPVTGLWVLRVDDIYSVTGLLVRGVAYASSGAVLLPDNAPADGVPWTALGFADQPDVSYPGSPVGVAVTALWGWAAVPAQVVAATKLQVSRWSSRRDTPTGVAGSPADGSQIRLLSRLDPDVATTLAGLSRRRRVG